VHHASANPSRHHHQRRRRAPDEHVAAPRALDPHDAADHLTRLHRLAWALCGCPHTAEDLVQETYLRVLSRPRFLRKGDDFSYLARALRNQLVNHARAGARRGRPGPSLDEIDVADARRTDDPERALMAAEVYRTIAELPDEQRDVIAAVDVAGLSYVEAAKTLEVPVGTVTSRLYRARAQVARLIDG
jgi:RNA polymerase sigma-70 factor (ECF subfamily)